MKRALSRLLTVIAVSASATFACAVPALACTAVYVGADASSDGTTIMAKSNDDQDVWGNYVEVTQRVDNQPGRTMPIDGEGTVLTELPATTYRYTSTPSMESATKPNGLEANDAAVCVNEMGVSMIMSVTAFSNEAALAADPLVEHGICEFSAVDLVTCQSATAREAVEVLCGLIDRYGSSEVNIALIADQQESWYVEMYSGHQYAAVKLPDDMVAAFGNEFSLEYLDGYEDHIASANLETLPDKQGFAVRDETGELNLLATYSGSSVVEDYSHLRTWYAHKLLAPSSYGDYSQQSIYPLCFKAEGKVSLEDVFAIIRNRYEGTEYSPDETGRTDVRVIGTDTALSVHVVQTYRDLPAAIACVTWESTGPAIYGTFVPVSNGALGVSEAYGKDQGADAAGVFDTYNYPYYRFKALCTLCVGQDSWKTYGKPVREYWARAEKGMTTGMAEVLVKAAELDDVEAARSYITDYCSALQQQAFDDAGQLLNDVLWYKGKNSNTYKMGTNPETGEEYDLTESLEPMEVTLDASVYETVPEADEQGATGTEEERPSTVEFGVLVGLVACCALAAVAFATRQRR